MGVGAGAGLRVGGGRTTQGGLGAGVGAGAGLEGGWGRATRGGGGTGAGTDLAGALFTVT